MKKILILITALLTMVSLVGCQKQQPTETPPLDIPSLQTKEEEISLKAVKLASLTATTVEQENSSTKAKMGVRLSKTTPNYQFVVLVENEIDFTLVIKLDNPEDYHIFDFTLTCDDENAKVLVNGEYKLLTELKSINWRGDTNTQYSLKMQVSSEKYLTTVALSSMYYSDRLTSENKYEVDLDNKGTISVYRVNEGLKAEILDFDTVKFTLNDERVDTSSIKVNGNAYELGTNYEEWTTTYNITYNYVIGDNIISKGSMTFTKENFYTNAYKHMYGYKLFVNPKYIDADGVNIKVYYGSKLICEGIATTDNPNLEMYDLNMDVLYWEHTYFMVDDQYRICETPFSGFLFKEA